jgi:membrane protein DedA with SNARE-associated domain
MLLLPTDLASFLEIIRQNGEIVYSLMFTYASSHSLLFALFGGYASYSGTLNLGGVIVACWAGSFFSDVIRFWIGKRFGVRWLNRFPNVQRIVQSVALMAERQGVRGLAGFAYGISNLSWPKFLVLNFIAAGIWAGVVVSAGYAFGGVSEKILNDASSSLGMVMLVVFFGLSWLLGKKLEAVADQNLVAQKDNAGAL